MPCGKKPRFVLLYGSQKGQAQSIAEGVAEVAEEHGLTAELSCLDTNAKYNLELETAPVVFIVSTTGDGEPPDNTLQFVKRIKKKSLASDHYKHLRYALLALGDTNYANFCNCGKTIERRLQELGARQFYATGYADDGVGLEVVVDPWLDGLWEAIKEALSKMNAAEAAESCPPDVQLNLLSITDHDGPQQQSREEVPTSPASPSASPAQPAVSDLGSVPPTRSSESASRPCDAAAAPTSAAGPQKDQAELSHAEPVASLTRSLPPLSESSLNVPALPSPYLEVSLQQAETTVEIDGPLDKENLHEVPVSKAVRLTSGESVKTALLLELDISAHPTMTYQPGDSFNVFCPNRAAEVEDMLHRLRLYDQRNYAVNICLSKDTKKKGAQVPSHIPKNVSLLYLLTWCLEIRTVPKKAFLRALVEHTADGGQRRRLQELCSKQGTADYNAYLRDPSLGVLELLAAFPSCSPPLSLLIEHVPKLQPRPYSAASSPLRHPGKLRFVFNVVEFPACHGRPAGRRGLCTGGLFDLIGPALAEPSGAAPLPKVHVSLRPSCTFRPPADLSVPFVMVGPGTGVAPFIGFLQQREKQRQENPGADCGETWLFFGCRHRDGDFLFREELEGFVSSGALSHLQVCFSRDTAAAAAAAPEDVGPEAPCRYVQHALQRRGRAVADVLLSRNGRIYVCGDARNMAKDVNDALVETIRAELQVDQLEAMKTLAALREERRYLQDVWA